MPQLMPLKWIFSSVMVAFILMVVNLIYSFDYKNLVNSSESMLMKGGLNWCW